MKSRIIATLILTAMFTSGCDNVSDVTNKTNYWGKYQKNEKYITKIPLFLIKVESNEAEYALVPEGEYESNLRRHYNRPKSIKEYQKGKLEIQNEIAYQIPIEVIAVIEKGTVIEPKKALKFTSYSWFFGKAEYVRIFGRLNDIKFNKYLVDLEDISERDFGGKESCCRNHSPNSDLVGKISPNNALVGTLHRYAARAPQL